MRWRGKQSEALLDATHALDIEGAIRASKTTICLWKEHSAMVNSPGIHTLLSRWTDDATDTLLRPLWSEILQSSGLGDAVTWSAEEHCYKFTNGSRAYMLGLKAPDELRRYSKFRGLTLARAYVDQAEELPEDVYRELKGRLSQRGFPRQIVISPNAVGNDHWIAKEFPPDNHLPNRKYIPLSVYDNAHNLDAEYLTELENTYPEGHPKRRTMILGLRGLNVIGTPVYRDYFSKHLHVRPIPYDDNAPLYEAIDFGKRHPAWIIAQRPFSGGWAVLGGILGHDLFLDDFIPIVQRFRAEWFPRVFRLETCCDPAGTHASAHGVRFTGVQVLIEHGLKPGWFEDSNAPDVRGAMIEHLAGYMRRRGLRGEAFGVESNPARWLRVTSTDVINETFLADALEAGYVWDEHFVSVGNKQVRKPLKDGWYEHGMNCLEYLERNFGAEAPTGEMRAKRSAERKAVEQRLLGASEPSTAWMGA